jgi:hypothetical protein
MRLLRAIVVVLAAACLFVGGGASARAQADFVQGGSDLDIALPDYLAKAGPNVKLVEAGDLKIDGHTMICGKRPTVIDNTFDSWGGAYPGYLILNKERLKNLSTPVKLFVYAHECGHQFIGRNEEAADCFGVKRGRRYGWLTEEGLAQVCDFISKLKGDADHAAGPRRCEKMRRCYIDAAPRASRN